LRFIHLDSVASTNESARDFIAQGDFGPLWIQAGEQTGGKGRRGRTWVSKPGNLYCTGLYPFAGDQAAAARLSFAAALSVAEFTAEYVDRNSISLKWPNDILINGAKTAGILLESGTHHGQGWVMAGIGVNLARHPEGTPYPATHIMEHIPKEVFQSDEPDVPAPHTAVAMIARNFSKWMMIGDQRGFSAIREAWSDWAKDLPGPVTVNLPNESFSGEGLGLGENGELQVRLEDGTMRLVHAGDVFYGGQ